MSQHNIDHDRDLDRLHAVIDVVCEDRDLALATLKSWQPVIEAAKAWMEAYDNDCLHPERGEQPEVALWCAVKSLLAAEGE